MSQRFTIVFGGSVELLVSEIWPDGDAPKDPTIADVLEAMGGSAHSKTYLLDDWNLEKDLRVYVNDEQGCMGEFKP